MTSAARLGLCILAALLLASTGAAQGRKTDPIEQTNPALAFGGTNYFAIWDQLDPNDKTYLANYKQTLKNLGK